MQNQKMPGEPGAQTHLSLPEILARIGSARMIASVSGGKDSSAARLYLRELGIETEPTFMDTGWESRVTYEYLRGPLEAAIGPIRWLRAEVDLPPDREAMALEIEGMLGHYSAMVRLCLKKVGFPARTMRWCTDELKRAAMEMWLNTVNDDVVSVLGIRAEESADRAALSEWEWSDKLDRWTWRPIHGWSLDDVIAIHARHGLRPNPLYLLGASRVGCWPCIFSLKSEIRFVADNDPDRIAVIQRLEQMVADLYTRPEMGRAVNENGEPYLPPTWFQANSERTPDMRLTGYAYPIDRAVEWSRTARGGKQVELFAAPARDAGCMRWGMCDTGSSNANR